MDDKFAGGMLVGFLVGVVLIVTFVSILLHYGGQVQQPVPPHEPCEQGEPDARCPQGYAIPLPSKLGFGKGTV